MRRSTGAAVWASDDAANAVVMVSARMVRRKALMTTASMIGGLLFPRHCERSEAIQLLRRMTKAGLLRRFAPRNDGGESAPRLPLLAREERLEGGDCLVRAHARAEQMALL